MDTAPVDVSQSGEEIPEEVHGVHVADFDQYPATDAELTVVAAVAHLFDYIHHAPDGTGVGGAPPPPMFPVVFHAAFMIAPRRRLQPGGVSVPSSEDIQEAFRLAKCPIDRVRDPAIAYLTAMAAHHRDVATDIDMQGVPLLCAFYLSEHSWHPQLQRNVLGLLQAIARHFTLQSVTLSLAFARCPSKYCVTEQILRHVRNPVSDFAVLAIEGIGSMVNYAAHLPHARHRISFAMGADVVAVLMEIITCSDQPFAKVTAAASTLFSFHGHQASAVEALMPAMKHPLHNPDLAADAVALALRVTNSVGVRTLVDSGVVRHIIAHMTDVGYIDGMLAVLTAVCRSHPDKWHVVDSGFLQVFPALRSRDNLRTEAVVLLSELFALPDFRLLQRVLNDVPQIVPLIVRRAFISCANVADATDNDGDKKAHAMYFTRMVLAAGTAERAQLVAAGAPEELVGQVLQRAQAGTA